MGQRVPPRPARVSLSGHAAARAAAARWRPRNCGCRSARERSCRLLLTCRVRAACPDRADLGRARPAADVAHARGCSPACGADYPVDRSPFAAVLTALAVGAGRVYARQRPGLSHEPAATATPLAAPTPKEPSGFATAPRRRARTPRLTRVLGRGLRPPQCGEIRRGLRSPARVKARKQGRRTSQARRARVRSAIARPGRRRMR